MAERQRVVIVGAGFGGLACAQALQRCPVDVVLIDRRNHHLFQPLLYQVATAALSPAQIAQPIRAILREQKNCTVVLGEVTAVDVENRLVKGRNGELRYDQIVLATGATHAYFGHDDWAKVAPGLKSIEDATAIRRKILAAFEKAEASFDPAEQSALLTFIVVGGGPTGVEMAGAIADLARHTLKGEFRRIDPSRARIILAEGGDEILKAFPAKLSARAHRDLERLGVEVRTGEIIADCREDGAMLGGAFIAARTIIWAAGVQASPAASWLGAAHDRAGRVIVGDDLTVPGHPEIFVIGDSAAATSVDGSPVPGLAPAAVQQGKHVAKTIAARLAGKAPPGPFAYRNHGTMATIGRAKAIADFKHFRAAGFLAWLLWGLVHLMPLVGFRNRFIVACDWLWSYFTHERAVRLITVTRASDSEI